MKIEDDNIDISIIIPVYNSEKYIRRCLDSVLNQSYNNYEIIVINDGSKDSSKEILDEYEKNFPDKIIHIEQKNKGVAKTRNYGIQIARGKYIMFIDNDDFIDKDYLKKYINAIKDSNYDAVIGGYRRPNQNGKIIKTLKLENEPWSKMMVLAPWAKIYKRDYLIKNNIEFLDNNIGEDVYFNLQAMLLSEDIKIVDYIGYNWYFNTKSVSNTLQKDIRNLKVYYLLDKCYNVLKEKNILDSNYEIVEMQFIRYVIWFLSYSTKRLSYSIIAKEYDKIFNWLYVHFPNYKKNRLIGFGKPKGEIKSIQFLYLNFMIFHKIHLGKLLVYLYSKI